jgi:hypothetical protein
MAGTTVTSNQMGNVTKVGLEALFADPHLCREKLLSLHPEPISFAPENAAKSY